MTRKLKKHLNKNFEMKDTGMPNKFVYLEIERKRRIMYIHQNKMIEKMLHRYGMQDSRPITTIINTKDAEKKGEGSNMFPLRHQCRLSTSSLLLIDACCKTDIGF